MGLVMFDYDGVIVNSQEFFLPDFLAACHENGFTEPKGSEDIMALFEDNVFQSMMKKGLAPDIIDKILKSYETKAKLHVDRIKTFAGIDKALKKISAGNTVYIITSNLSDVTAAVLRRNGIECFDGVLGADVEKSKIKKIQMVMQQHPDLQAYYVGDTCGDMVEGKEAGAITVGVTWGWHGAERLKAGMPDHLVDSPEQLAGLLCSSRTDPSGNILGLALDIGTTIITASLTDLKDGGRELGTACYRNPQTVFGSDIFSRIGFARENWKNVTKIKNVLAEGINHLIGNICRQNGVSPEEILQVTAAGNSALMHLLIGLNPGGMAEAPFSPLVNDYLEIPAAKIGLQVSGKAIVSLLPPASAAVGADVLAGMIAVNFHQLQNPSLFIDIGDDVQIAANVHGQLAAVSCGIGSASSGMKLVASVSELVRKKVILPDGMFAEPSKLPKPLAERLIDYKGERAFLVDAGTMTVLTTDDIRRVKVAKAVISVAVNYLLNSLHSRIEDIEEIYISGSFGLHLSREALINTGILPPAPGIRTQFAGNTAVAGARLCLISEKALEEIKRLQKTIKTPDLLRMAGFLEKFAQHLDFPLSQEPVPHKKTCCL